MKQLILSIFILLFSCNSYSYSYAAAGKEPIIEGREAVLQALNRGDYDAAKQAYLTMQPEFVYFREHHDLDLDKQILSALQAQNNEQIKKVMHNAMIAEVERRLTGAATNLNDYQVAKVLVVKSKHFIDLIAPDLTQEKRQQADTAIRGALKAIGNPGVFGVGQTPADPASFEKYRLMLSDALAD